MTTSGHHFEHQEIGAAALRPAISQAGFWKAAKYAIIDSPGQIPTPCQCLHESCSISTRFTLKQMFIFCCGSLDPQKCCKATIFGPSFPAVMNLLVLAFSIVLHDFCRRTPGEPEPPRKFRLGPARQFRAQAGQIPIGRDAELYCCHGKPKSCREFNFRLLKPLPFKKYLDPLSIPEDVFKKTLEHRVTSDCWRVVEGLGG